MLQPVRIKDYGGYRDGSFFVELEGAEGRRIPFCFERFLGRLCYGSTNETGEDAAFLKKGSRVQAEAFALIEELARRSSGGDELSERDDLLDRLNRARRWV